MNKRVRELIAQAGGIQYDEDGDELTAILVGKDLEKFAVLIVKETMQVVANTLPQNTYLDVADAVIKHFGVEE
jgi:protein involved in polysaccharide export with SLBB domain